MATARLLSIIANGSMAVPVITVTIITHVAGIAVAGKLYRKKSPRLHLAARAFLLGKILTIQP